MKINDGAVAGIDTMTSDVSFASALQLGTLGNGGLTKSGAGTLSLTPAHPA